MSHIIVKGIKWYHTLLEGLFREYPRHDMSTEIIICWNVPNTTGKPSRLFAIFDTPLQLWDYIRVVEPAERHFFEVILGEHDHKPYFDIDVNDTNIKIAELTLGYLLTTLMKIGINLSNIRVYGSNSPEYPNKQSYHVLVQSHHCINSAQGKQLMKYCKDKICEPYNKYIDSTMYSTIQQFRLLGSTKTDGKRTKVLLHNYPVLLAQRASYVEFAESLVSVFITDTANITELIGDIDLTPVNDTVSITDVLTGDTISQAIRCLEEWSPSHAVFVKTLPAFNNAGQIIVLRRTRATHCSVCNDVHEHNNPYLLVREESIGRYDIYYYCRQAGNRATHIATLKADDESYPIYDNPVIEDYDPLGKIKTLTSEALKRSLLVSKMSYLIS